MAVARVVVRAVARVVANAVMVVVAVTVVRGGGRVGGGGGGRGGGCGGSGDGAGGGGVGAEGIPPREHLSHVYVEGGDEGLRWHGIIVVRRCHHGFGEVGGDICDHLS